MKLPTTEIFPNLQGRLDKGGDWTTSNTVLHLSSIYNTNITGKQINLSNIYYNDSVVQFKDNLIKIDNIETDNDFYIAINNISFSGITFERGGNLVLFQQQTSTKIIAYNCEFINKVVLKKLILNETRFFYTKLILTINFNFREQGLMIRQLNLSKLIKIKSMLIIKTNFVFDRNHCYI